jgi:hypothetical protein
MTGGVAWSSVVGPGLWGRGLAGLGRGLDDLGRGLDERLCIGRGGGPCRCGLDGVGGAYTALDRMGEGGLGWGRWRGEPALSRLHLQASTHCEPSTQQSASCTYR